MALSYEVYRRAAGQIALQLRGELSRDTARTFHRALSSALESTPSELLLDLRLVTALGAGGIGMLLAARRAAGELRCRFVLWSPTPAVERRIRAGDPDGLAAFIVA